MRDNLDVIGALLAVYLIWGSTYLAIRVAVQTFPPLLMIGIRFLLAGGGLFLFLRWRGAPAPTLPQWGGSAVVAVLLLMGGNGSVAIAEQHVPSSIAATMIATTPLWAALFNGLWGRWPNRREIAGLVVGFFGVVLLNLEGNLRANPGGALILLLASASWALGSVWNKSLPLPSGMMASAAEMLVGGFVILFSGLITGERLAAAPSTPSLIAFVYLATIGSLVAFSAYAFLLRRVRSSLATSYAYVNPMVAVLLGAGLAGEHIGPTGIAALFVILAGVGLVMVAGQKR